MKIQINEHFGDIKESYLFSDIAKRVNAYSEANPGKKIIRLGIGDVTLPLTQTVIAAMHRAVDEMASGAMRRNTVMTSCGRPLPITMRGLG